MSESETDRNDARPSEAGPSDETRPRPDVVPAPDDEGPDELSKHPADARAIPGEHPEDNPDKEGEERFDAG
jgi:hypothetical protein